MLVIAVVAFGRHLERPDKFGPFFFTEFQPLQLSQLSKRRGLTPIILDEQGIRL